MVKKITQEDFLMQLSEGLKGVGRAPNIKKYKPHAKQVQFHSSRKKKKLYIGGNRSGKTTGGVCEDIWWATKRHPYRPDVNAINEPIRGRVVAVSLTDGVEKILFPQFQQWLYPSALKGGAWETAYDKTLRTLTFSNDSFIEFMSYDQDLDKHAGTSRHFIHFDEEPPKSIYKEGLARLIDTDGSFWLTMTPVEGITWVYDDLYENHVGREETSVEVVEVNTLENPYLTQAAIQSFVDDSDGEDVTVRIAGQFVQKGGRIYKNFDPTVGGLHVLSEPIDEPEITFRKGWTWLQGLDHGLNNPTAVLWMAVDPNGFIVVFKEHYHRDWSVKQHAAEIHKIEAGWKRQPALRVADPSIQNRNAITMTSIHEEYATLGLPFTLGNNDVKAGLIRVKRYFQPQKLVGQQSEFIRRLAEERGVTELPRLMVTPDCTNFISEHKKYRWKTYVGKKQQYENNPYDEPHKKDDHTCDALRYPIMSQPDIKGENENLEQTFADVMSELDQKISFQEDFDIADPNNRAQGGWQEGFNQPSPAASGGWSYDENMGSEF